MQVLCFPVGEMSANCYYLIDESTQNCFIIDPGDDAEFLSTEILKRQLRPQAVLLTHGHFDHLLGTLELSLNFNLPVYLHPKDLFLYQKASRSARRFQPKNHTLKPPAHPLSLTDGQMLILGESTLKVIHTPGHTPGSVCFYDPPLLFTGDTLFADSVGRTDLAYSSKSDLEHSLRHLYSLPTNTLIYPGHQDFEVPIGR